MDPITEEQSLDYQISVSLETIRREEKLRNFSCERDGNVINIRGTKKCLDATDFSGQTTFEVEFSIDIDTKRHKCSLEINNEHIADPVHNADFQQSYAPIWNVATRILSAVTGHTEQQHEQKRTKNDIIH